MKVYAHCFAPLQLAIFACLYSVEKLIMFNFNFWLCFSQLYHFYGIHTLLQYFDTLS